MKRKLSEVEGDKSKTNPKTKQRTSIVRSKNKEFDTFFGVHHSLFDCG